jgi:hypothetical protein
MVGRGDGATRTGHLTLMSPAVLLKNALGFVLATNRIPATTTRTWLSLAVVVAGALAMAAWVFLRAQGVETWEATSRQRWTITLAMAALLLVPVFLADTNYDNLPPKANNAPAIRGLSRAGINAALVRPGGRMPGRCCGSVMNREDWPLGTDEPSQRDLLLLLPVETSAQVTNLNTRIAGEDGLEITADPDALAQPTPHLEAHTYSNDSGPTAPDGHHIATGWIARVPITLNPTKPWDIGGDRYPLTIAATYQVVGDSQPHVFNARSAIDAEVASAIYQMGAASILFPLLCLGAGFIRWRRTR